MEKSALVVKMFTKYPNAGDQFNHQLLQFFFSGRPVKAVGPELVLHPNLVLLGSVLQWADAQSLVCGAGLLSSAAVPLAQPRQILMLRGPLSADCLRLFGCDLPRYPAFADPGVLAPRLFPAAGTPQIPFAVIPHYVDMSNPALACVFDDGGVVIDPLQPLERYFDLLSQSQAILSSSLHGLIFAHAYGKPALWVEFSNRIHGEGFKFFDYYQSLGISPENVPRVTITPQHRLSALVHLSQYYDTAPLAVRADEHLRAASEIMGQLLDLS